MSGTFKMLNRELDEKSDDGTSQQNRRGFYAVLNDFNIDEMLSKYGPEGCFILANALREAAQNDMDEAMHEASEQSEYNRELIQDAETRFGISQKAT